MRRVDCLTRALSPLLSIFALLLTLFAGGISTARADEVQSGNSHRVQLASTTQQSTQLSPVDLAAPSVPGLIPQPQIVPEMPLQHTGAAAIPLENGGLTVTSPAACLQLDALSIGCKAAQNWIPSDLLRQRACTIVKLYAEEDECQQRAAAVLARFLNLQAKRQEEMGAASALRAYYTRIALAEQLALTVDSLQFVESESTKQSAAQEGGLPAGTDLTSFERHRLEIRDQQIQIHSNDRKLRCLLAQLTSVDYAMSDVCQEPLEVLEMQLHCPNLKQFALANRSDLRGWQLLAVNVNEESAPIFARMLGTLVGGWGLPIPLSVGIKAILCPPDYSTLAGNLRYELDLTVETHRRWICQAVEEKCAALQMSYQRIGIAQQMVMSWESRIAQLGELDGQTDSIAADLAEARSELLKARSEEISRRLDAKIAEIDLAEATGGISDRCCSGQPWLLTGFE